jgi:hypothetical protein
MDVEAGMTPRHDEIDNLLRDLPFPQKDPEHFVLKDLFQGLRVQRRGQLEERSFIVFEPTPKSKVRAKVTESSGMALVAAAPVLDEGGKIIGALYPGLLLNRNHGLVDKIRSMK